ncbi:MAG: hypothetical protein ACK5P6_01260 [Pseudobdellovibrionaceae bacterium]|jgi:hypothetical protein
MKFKIVPLSPQLKCPSLKDLCIFENQHQLFKKVFRASAADWSKDSAKIKSYHQLATQMINFKMDPQNPFAGGGCHSSAKEAKNAAYRDLLRIDSVLTRQLIQAPLQKQIPPRTATLKKIAQDLKKCGVTTLYFRLPCLDKKIQVFVCVLVSHVSPYKLAAASAAHESAPQAQMESFLAALVILNGLLCHRLQPILQKELMVKLKTNSCSAEDHFRATLAPEVQSQFMHQYLDPRKSLKIVSQKKKKFMHKEIVVKKYSLAGTEFEKFGLNYYKASSQVTQNLFYGQPTPERINFKRLVQEHSKLRVKDIPWTQFHIIS